MAQKVGKRAELLGSAEGGAGAGAGAGGIEEQEEGGMSSSSKRQIELLSPRQNGTAAVDGGGSTGVEEKNSSSSGSKSNRASIIRGMWKKAFKGLSSNNKDKDKGKQQDKNTEKENEKEEKMKSETGDDKRSVLKQYTRQSSLKKMILKRKDSKESKESRENVDDVEDCKYLKQPGAGGSADPIFDTLRVAANMRRPPPLSEEGAMASSYEGTAADAYAPDEDWDNPVKPGSSKDLYWE